MVEVKVTDLNLLRSLLDAGKTHLAPAESTAFTGMLRDLESGLVVRLSKSQRFWAESKYNSLDLGKAYKDKPVPKVKLKKPQSAPLIWEQPRALKPPGK